MGRLRPLQCYEHTKSHRARLSRMQEKESLANCCCFTTKIVIVCMVMVVTMAKKYSQYLAYLGLVALPVVFLKPKLVLNSGPNQLLNGNFPDGKIFHFTRNFNCREYRCHILV